MDRKGVNLLFKILPVHSATLFWSSSAWWKAGTQVLFCLGKKSVMNSQLSDGGFTARTCLAVSCEKSWEQFSVLILHPVHSQCKKRC